ncbi:MAG: hypothetical protein JRH18_13860 [Deltaproteobacteria bacterium]|nr:hypothetical protein [Deltaproteobacteria bacterium]MBW2152741.1 hypothetical protein [Deltaproteobacteria bacterium]
MKRWICLTLTVVWVLASIELVFGAENTPVVSASQMVKLEKDAAVLIMGWGFKPGQKLAILYTDPNGVSSDLEAYLDPKPVADSKGQWSTVWNCSRYISKKLIREGVTAIRVTDSDYNLLAHASIAFYKGEKKLPDKPPIVVATPMVKMEKGAEVTIMGWNFTSGQELSILYTDPNGVTADIESSLMTPPVANKNGEWATTWKCGRYISKKLIKEGVTTIQVTDKDYNLLAHDSIAFYVK